MIIIRLMGGLGNQMFQYAFGRYLAQKYKTTLKLDLSLLNEKTDNPNVVYRNYELGIFSLKPEFATKKDLNFFDPLNINNIVLKLKNKFIRQVWYSQNNHEFSKSQLNIPDNTIITGRWQSEMYFNEISDMIRKDFTFKVKSEKSIFENPAKNENTVAIHVRRTDYITNKLYSEKIGALEIDYYKNAIKYMKNKIENPVFYFFSDDINWCKIHFGSEKNMFFSNNSSAKDDLQNMTFCKNFIISNSTFVWWGAWLGSYKKDSIFIAPQKWANDTDYIPPKIYNDNRIKL